MWDSFLKVGYFGTGNWSQIRRGRLTVDDLRSVIWPSFGMCYQVTNVTLTTEKKPHLPHVTLSNISLIEEPPKHVVPMISLAWIRPLGMFFFCYRRRQPFGRPDPRNGCKVGWAGDMGCGGPKHLPKSISLIFRESGF